MKTSILTLSYLLKFNEMMPLETLFWNKSNGPGINLKLEKVNGFPVRNEAIISTQSQAYVMRGDIIEGSVTLKRQLL